MSGLDFADRVVDSCDSTNELARRLGEAGFPHGTWISARTQSAGRGRLGRQWQSQEGGLFLSVVLRIDPARLGRVLTWVPLGIAVAAVEAAAELAPERRLAIKWPNDLWLSGAKCGGILCESVGNAAGSFVVAGIGLNCASAPKGLDQATAALGALVDELRPRVIARVLEVISELQDAGTERIRARYLRYTITGPGAPVRWTSAEGWVDGTVVGLGELGELRVRSLDGSERTLYAEDVSLRPV